MYVDPSYPKYFISFIHIFSSSRSLAIHLRIIPVHATHFGATAAICLRIGASNLIAGSRASSKDLAILLNVQNGSSVRVESGAVRSGSGAGESDGAKVGKSDQGITLLELIAHFVNIL